MSVTIVSCAYGTFARFVPRWEECVNVLNPRPDAIIVAGDRPHQIIGAQTIESECTWKHPQAFYLNLAIAAATTEWVWIVDIDDCPMIDGLAGLDEVAADVWQMGYVTSNSELYVPEPADADDYLASWKNQFVAGSAVRTESFRKVGGFADVAFQDWSLWRRLAQAGATFEFSDCAHYVYMRHQYTRTETELGLDRRPEHLAEMMEAELAVA